MFRCGSRPGTRRRGKGGAEVAIMDPRNDRRTPGGDGPEEFLRRLLFHVFFLLTFVVSAGFPSTDGGRAFAARGLAVPVASSLTIEHKEDAAVLTASLTYAIPFNVYVLSSPYRVMIDMPDVDFRLKGRVRNSSGGLVRAVRYGRMAPGKARIVLEVDGPVLIRRSYALHPQGARPARLVVELVRTDEGTFRALLAAVGGNGPEDAAGGGRSAPSDTRPLRAGDPVPEDLPVITRAYRRLVEMAAAGEEPRRPSSIADLLEDAPVGFDMPASPGGRKAEAVGDGKPAARVRKGRKERKTAGKGGGNVSSSRRPLIVIDPGHGGKDPGAIGYRGHREKDLVLAFARTLADTLRATGRYRVLLTRGGDTFLTLRERVRYARRHDAALFISIHADKFRTRSVHGAAIYTLSEKASDEEAAELARTENAADVIDGVDLGADSDAIRGILIDLTMRETKNHSIWLARNLASRLRRVTKVRPRPVRSADFRVLRNPDVPAVLVELGYVSNARDVRNMLSTRWRKRIARAMTEAVNRYFTSRLAMGR